MVAAFARFARDRGLTPAQLAIAWVRAKRPTDLPLIGARTPAQLVEALGALARALSPAEVAELEAMIAPSAIVGTRYDAAQMSRLDSERR